MRPRSVCTLNARLSIFLLMLFALPAAYAQQEQTNPQETDTLVTSEPPRQAASPAGPSDQTMGLRPSVLSHELTVDDRVRIYKKSVFSANAILTPALGAGIDQWQDDPHEWEQGMAGYGRRLGSALGKNLSNKTLVFGIAMADGEDPRYFASGSSGFLARTGHAVASAFVSYREDGSRGPAYAHFGGAYGSSFLAMTWYPPSKSTAQHALIQGTTKLAMNAGMNMLREFWPDIKRRLHFGD